MQISVRGESVPFDFVEGLVNTGDWVTSELEPDLYVIENDRRTNLGAPIDNPSFWWDAGTVRQYRSGANSGAAGDEYLTSESSGARFRWYFTTELEGQYDVYASCRGLRNRDPSARYRVYRDGPDRYSTHDQRHLGEFRKAYLGRISYRAGQRNTIEVTRGRGRLCADAIFLRYND